MTDRAENRDKNKTSGREMAGANQKRQLALRAPYGEAFQSWPRLSKADSHQFLQLPALVTLLCPETFKVIVQLLQLQLLLLVTTENRNNGSLRESSEIFNAFKWK